jgi:hypothetical protein
MFPNEHMLAILAVLNLLETLKTTYVHFNSAILQKCTCYQYRRTGEWTEISVILMIARYGTSVALMVLVLSSA